ncbi:DUF2971 domain-containing protein [Psychromonas arctica]|uniref:DUF2971 domain-containing protein n=2 Tax=Gammaproteobacteria TaxID=1236 RepID=A0ABU9H8Y8_9GAMM
MPNISEKEIITAIKAKHYSALTFLEESRGASENEWYLGFYYFIQDLKQENTQTTFNEIVSKYGNESSAYCYLGDTASKIYSEILNEHIPTCFYKKSVELDNGNIDAHWGLYNKDHNMNSWFDVLEFHYKKCQYDNVIDIIDNTYITFQNTKDLLAIQWRLIKKIVMDDNVTCKSKILILAHFHLDEIDEGLTLVNSMDKISYDIIQPYAEKGLVDKEKVISNIYPFQVHDFCKNDHKSIYQKHLKENFMTRESIIKFAFQAKEFDDVITHYDEAPENDILFRHSFSARIYYLLAKLKLNDELDEEILQFTHKKSDSLEGENNSLYKVLKFKLKTKELEDRFKSGQSLQDLIDFFDTYIQAKNIIDSPELMTYFQYSTLKEELKAIKDQWNQSYYQNEFEKRKNKKLGLTLLDQDLLGFYNLAIKAEAYDYVIDNIVAHHKKNIPTMASHNILGVCYERKEQLSLAFEQYKCALNLMLSSEEKDHVIIGNYISAGKKLSDINISEEDFVKLKQIFNTAITNQFQWNTFTADGGKHLFKYSYFNMNTLDALTNQYFYLSSREQLNDPIELPMLNKVGEGQLIDSNYRTFSLSHNINSMLMWSHYAEEHQGIMIEYWFGGELPEGVGIEKISYTEELKRNEEQDLFIFNQFLLTKNKGWEYEREVRLFSNNTNKIYFEKFDYPNHDRNKINAEITSITLGCKFPENKKELITNIITKINNDKRKSEQKISLKEAYISEDDKFAIKYREIDI